MKTEMITSKNDFINLLEFVINKINVELGVDLTYEIHYNCVTFRDSITQHEILRFLFDKRYNCFAFDSDLLRFHIDDSPCYDFLLDILNEII